MFNLRYWLKKKPVPTKIRVKTEDGEEQLIEVGHARDRWHATEEAVRACGAATIQALDSKGVVLRASRLTESDAEADDDDDAKEKYDDKLLTRDRRDQAAILDRYGARMNEAFHAGAQAAGVSQDHLVALVETLSGQLAGAIVSVHNMAVNLANVVQSNAQQVAELRAALIEGAAENGTGQSGEAMKLLQTVLAVKGAEDSPNGKKASR